MSRYSYFKKTKILKATAIPLLVGLLALASSCSTPEVSTEERHRALILQDQTLGPDYVAWVEKTLKIRKSDIIQNYLSGIADELKRNTDHLKRSSFVLKLHKGKKAQARNFSLPGLYLYMNTELLNIVEYENEVAALIALELAHIELRHLFQNIEFDESQSKLKEDFIADYIFSGFDFSQVSEAIPVAVGILYRSNYDPRGLTHVWDHISENLKKFSYDQSQIKEFDTLTFRAISSYAPLSNPIVQTEKFKRLKGAISNL